ncbi:glutaredoxin family protein [Agromyces subbeticus]|uniref:glutaredoxin family protein n=1 Tax=Agromyces subbeticus TaxID=293890 RepID=UPI0003B7A7C7|nr:glutaredoxin family protein [Agromyces subbeticus]
MATTVTMYTKPDCVQCTGTYRHFESKGIKPDSDHADFVVRDAFEDKDAYDFLMESGLRQMPVLMVDDLESGESQQWTGFNPSKIEEAAALLIAQRETLVNA